MIYAYVGLGCIGYIGLTLIIVQFMAFNATCYKEIEKDA
jgi:hypothetical protein